MKRVSFILLFLFLLNWISVEAVCIISLGGDCTVAGALRDSGLRRAAYPFDWMFSPLESIYDAIVDDFKNFLNPALLKISDKDERIIFDFYGFGFVHDFPTVAAPPAIAESQSHPWGRFRDDWRDFIQPIREKYFRRINRLKSVLNSEDRVILIRFVSVRFPLQSNKTVVKLRNFLLERYPHLDFTLVVVSDSRNSILPEWNLENIRTFSIFPDKANWVILLRSLGVDLSQIRSAPLLNQWGCDGHCDDYTDSEKLIF